MLAVEFIEIDQVSHRFPQEIKEIGFSTTLLHHHSHAPPDSVLVYMKDFSKAEYRPLAEARSYFPCSWYWSNGPVAYEFCDEQL